jgi:TolA-binding protein
MIMRGTTPRKLSTASICGLVILGGIAMAVAPGLAEQRSTAENLSAFEPQSRTAPADDQDAELARLRQQEASLRQAMDAVARSLDQTRKQLRDMQGAPTQPAQPAAARTRSRNVQATEAQPLAAAVPEPPVALRRSASTLPLAAPVRARNRGEQPVEERLGRLEEQMSQIANEIQALRRDMRGGRPPATQPRRPSVNTPSALEPSEAITPVPPSPPGVAPPSFVPQPSIGIAPPIAEVPEAASAPAIAPVLPVPVAPAAPALRRSRPLQLKPESDPTPLAIPSPTTRPAENAVPVRPVNPPPAPRGPELPDNSPSRSNSAGR